MVQLNKDNKTDVSLLEIQRPLSSELIKDYNHKEAMKDIHDIFLQLEDNFCKYLSFTETTNEYTNIAMWNVKKGKAITIKRIVEVLRNNQYTAEVSRRLYAYYKYFSQYEHFSESGYGDTLADFDKDNISFEKAFECLISGMYLLLENIKTSPEILSNS